jgi:hypothetical protein
MPYRSMAYNNAWAGFFPSIRATLNHILVIDRFYVDAMEGGKLGPRAWADPEPCGTVEALRRAQANVDRRLVDLAERLDDMALQRTVAVHRCADRISRFRRSKQEPQERRPLDHLEEGGRELPGDRAPKRRLAFEQVRHMCHGDGARGEPLGEHREAVDLRDDYPEHRDVGGASSISSIWSTGP